MDHLPCVGLRREDMYQWERRTPLVPNDMRELSQHLGVEFAVQSSPKRAYSDQEYRSAGLSVVEHLKPCPLVIGLKEIPLEVLEEEKVYVFFSHVIKGQPHNMPMLQRAIDRRCTIIDYERIVDAQGKRLIAFGNYAGLAGMIDTLWTLGRRLTWEGIESPFSTLRQASQYADLAEAKSAVRDVAARIAAHGLPEEIVPCTIGVAGYGNVSRGVQEILDLLPITPTEPSALLDGQLPDSARHTIFKVVFQEKDTVLPLDPAKAFHLQEFYDHPERYRAAFRRYLPHLTALVNCIYWEPKYPRLVSRGDAQDLIAAGPPKLRVIGDISCDVRGGIEITVQATEPDNPVYVVDPESDSIQHGVEGRGLVILAVEILPTELPREASAYFSNLLKQFIPDLVKADYRAPFHELRLPSELKQAVICHRGALTPDYAALEKHLASASSHE